MRTVKPSISAFAEHRLDWHWSTSDYVALARRHRGQGAAGGIRRIASTFEPKNARRSRRAFRPSIAPRRDHYARLVREGLRAIARRDQAPAQRGRKRRRNDSPSPRPPRETTSTPCSAPISARAPLGRFSVIGAGDAVAHKKPAPDIYRFVLRELGESCVDCVAVEDSRPGTCRRETRRTLYRGHAERLDAAERIFPPRICC